MDTQQNKPENRGWGGTPQASNTGAQGQTPPPNNRGWGGVPQASNTGAQGQTPPPNSRGWGGAPQASNTGAQGQTPPPNSRGWGGTPQASNTGNEQQAPQPGDHAPERDNYTIDGITYKVIRVISSNSGEARIFEIENGGNHFALKLYRCGVHPNHEVLERVMNLNGNGMLIDIYAHGVWRDPSTGTDHDYEIMEYCSGGSLANLRLTGDEQRMRETALRMAAMLDFAHNHGILHRDVKPANFLFTDESHSRFVLTDWGLAKTLDSQRRTVTDAGRTKIYAAPEMYTYMYDTPTYVGAKADYFSMGMTLMALWMGEGLLTADESKLVDDKQGETLPYPAPSTISRELLSLMKALTRRNPDRRAGFDEITRWARGEEIYADSSTDESLREFRIVFSAEKKLIAHNPAELGRMMWTERELAKQYLYSDEAEIYKWLMDAERSELAAGIRNITTRQYPTNCDAGLFAACLLLDPEGTLYEGLDGKPLSTQQEIARELWHNASAYRKALYNKKEHPLWAYLSARGLKDRIADFRRLIRNDGEAGVRSIAYYLDPSLPYRLMTKDSKGIAGYKDINTLEQLAPVLSQSNVTNKECLSSDDFLIWAAHRNAALAGKAKQTAERTDIDDDFKFKVISYQLLPGYDYVYQPLEGSDKATPEQLAALIQPDFKITRIGMDRVNISRLAGPVNDIIPYLTARGKYDRQVSWIRYCLDTDSADNRKKFVPYNKNIALFKAAAGLMGSVVPLVIDSMRFATLDDVKSADLSGLTWAHHDTIADWVTLFFQEEPNADYKKESYYSRASRYCDFICTYLPNSQAAERAKKKMAVIANARKSYKRASAGLTGLKWVIALLCMLPLALVTGAGVYLLITQGASEIGGVMATVGTWAGIIIGVIAGLATLGETESWILGGIVGVVCFALIKAGLVFIAPAVPWIILAFFLVQLIVSGYKTFFASHFSSVASSYSDLSLDEAAQRAVMGRAFGSIPKLLPSALPDDYPENVYRTDGAAKKKLCKSLLKSVVWLIVVTAGACAFCVWIYRMDPDKAAAWDSRHGVEMLSGEFKGDVKGTPLTISFGRSGETLNADMDIRYRSGATRQTMTVSGVKTFPVVMAKTDDPAITLTIDTAYVISGQTVAKGSYLNSKGNRQPVNVTK